MLREARLCLALRLPNARLTTTLRSRIDRARRRMESTVDKGNRFRDLLVSMLEAAGFAAEGEVRVGHKKVDTKWRREETDGSVQYLVEAKDYESTIDLDLCRDFLSD